MTSGGGVVACAGVPMAKARNAEISIPLSGAPKLRAVIHPPTVDCGSLLLDGENNRSVGTLGDIQDRGGDRALEVPINHAQRGGIVHDCEVGHDRAADRLAMLRRVRVLPQSYSRQKQRGS